MLDQDTVKPSTRETVERAGADAPRCSTLTLDLELSTIDLEPIPCAPNLKPYTFNANLNLEP